MYIILVGPTAPYRGGLSRHTACLAQALARGDHRVEVVSFRRQYPPGLYPGRSDLDPDPQLPPGKVSYLLRLANPFSWLKTASYILRQQPDLVLLQWWHTAWAIPFAWMVARLRRKGIRVAYMVHNVLPHERHPFDRILAWLALRRADAWLVHAESQRQALEQIIPDALALQTPHPAFPPLPGSLLPPSQARQKLGLPDDRPVILFFGMLRPYKGLDVLLDALAQLESSQPLPLLVVAGEFWRGMQSLRERLVPLEQSGAARVIDTYLPDEQAGLYFAAASFLVAPYTGGTQSGVLGMALGCGLPAIATPFCDPPGEHPGVRVVPAGDVAALAHALQDWLVHPPARTPPATIAAWRDLANLVAGLAFRKPL